MSQGPAVPAYIFRGHASAIHALHFLPSNLYLASGDGDGWIVIWSLATKRPVAVWKGHDGGIMGLKDWCGNRLISHGRDHALRIWQIRPDDLQGRLDTSLPVDNATSGKDNQPWLLHSLPANALNYCAFAMCDDPASSDKDDSHDESDPSFDPILIATPNGLDAGGVDIFHVPSERRVCKMVSQKDVQTGMVMAVSIFQHAVTKQLMLLAGYESGHVLMFARSDIRSDGEWNWRRLLSCAPHSQPILAIDVSHDRRTFLSSSADATIAKFDVASIETGTDKARKTSNTNHAGQQDLKIRDDGKILATAGWDQRVRVYSLKSLKELAVLKWHTEGCYAVAFAPTNHGARVQESLKTGGEIGKTTLDLLKDARNVKAQNTHWLAAGGKDGKISLWDIY